MSKSRLSNTRRKARAAPVEGKSGRKKFQRFIGISLSGGKSDKSSLAVLDYYPDEKRLFLSRLIDRVKTEEFMSADYKLHEMIHQFSGNVEMIAFDVPLTLPKCISCKLKCPGYETCSEPEMIWLRNFFAEVNKDKKPRKLFTPYTQRCSDAYLGQSLETHFEIQHALGANLAPLSARAHFIRRRLTQDCVEVSSKVATYRLGKQMRLGTAHLKNFRSVVDGDQSRRLLLQALSDRRGLFFYDQDQKLMIESSHAFEAFICAYTAFLSTINETESRPSGFPRSELWPLIPRN